MTPLPPPTMRESSNEQDAPATTGETAVQGRPSRSILKQLHVERVAPSVVRPLMIEHHYLHSMPAASRRCYAISLDGMLRGGAVFTSGARNGHRLLAAARPADVVTLARLWLSDDLPANSESRVLGIVLRDLRRTTDWKLLLSYADPAAGHVGTIYQATGWIYLGETAGETYVRLADGRLHHPRSVYSCYGSNRISHLQATGIPARRECVGGKFRYAYVLDPAWRWRVCSIQPPGLPRPRPPPGQPLACIATRQQEPAVAAIHGRVKIQESVMKTCSQILPVIDAPPRRVYVASPMTIYLTARYNQKVAAIVEPYPAADLLLARDRYRSNADWQRQWPLLVPTITDLVFFAELDRTIGLGVWSEMHDVADLIPVWFLDDVSGWHPLDDVEIDMLGESMERFARVVVPAQSHRVADV